MDKRQYDHDGITELLDAGATMFLCLADKRPAAKGWQERKFTSADALLTAYERSPVARFIGMIPATAGLLVIDVDKGAVERVVKMLMAADVGCVSHETGRGHHIWVRTDAEMGNRKWSNEHASGDVRSAKGYVVLWDADAALEALELAPCNAAFVLRTITDTYQAGERNNEFFKDAAKALRTGGDPQQYVDKALASGLPQDEVDRSLASAKEAVAADLASKGEKYLGVTASPGTLAKGLQRLGLDYRYDSRAARPALKRKDGEWQALTDRAVARLCWKFEEFFTVGDPENPEKRRAHKLGVNRFYQWMNALVYDKEADPFLEWIELLPDWDGVERVQGFLQKYFGAVDDELTRWAGRYLFVGPIQRAVKPGCELDEMPVLVGKQGIGKSKMLRWLLPENRQDEWFSDSLELTGETKRQVEALEGRVIVEISEMSGAAIYSPERVKTFVSRQTDSMRAAYERNTENRPRVCVFVATTNTKQALPNDPSGNRRFVVVELTKGLRVQEVLAALREQLFAEGLDMYRRGIVANLPIELRGMARERGEEHRYSDERMEEGLETLPLMDSTLTQVLDHLGIEHPSRQESNRVKNELVRRGWVYKRVREKDKNGKSVVRKRWRPPGVLAV